MIGTKNSIKIFLIVLILLLPWGVPNLQDNVEAKNIDSTTVGYYQINTCDISFIEALLKNGFNENIIYEFDNYSSIKCFGKINGVDQVGENFKVAVGTNILINFLIQSFFWILLISFISKGEKREFKNKISSAAFLIVLFMLHLFGESKFYQISSKNFDLEVSFSNFFILSLILNFIIVIYFIWILFEYRLSNLILYLPFVFLLSSTFVYMNYNFLLLIFSFFGIQNLIETDFSKKYSLTYLSFCLFWLLNQNSNSYLFDVDKLRGFSNSSLNIPSVLFWMLSFYLLIHGIIYITKNSLQNIDHIVIVKNFLITGSLITFFGFLSAYSSIFNFFSYYYFGLNKRAMTEISSISGNTWRGLAPSAESIGEFFAYSIFIFLFYVYKKQIKITWLYAIFLLINIIGMIRANNVAAILSIIVLFILFVVNQKIEVKIRSILIFIIIIFLLILGFFFSAREISISPEVSYEVASKSLILEGLKYSNLFEGENDRNKNVSRYLEGENDLGTIFLYPGNSEAISSSLKFVSNAFTQNVNIPFVPNGIAALSLFALSINRSEKWGIFLSKYNPNTSEFLFGTGPLELNSYFYGHNTGNVDGLVLPHSSILDILLFFGFFGLLLFTFFVLKILVNNFNSDNPYWYLLLFLLINWVKSDSILYIGPFILFVFTLIQNIKITNKD